MPCIWCHAFRVLGCLILAFQMLFTATATPTSVQVNAKRATIQNPAKYEAQGRAIGILMQNAKLSARDLIALNRVNLEFREWIQSQKYWKFIQVLQLDTCKEFSKSVFVSPNHSSKHPGASSTDSVAVNDDVILEITRPRPLPARHHYELEEAQCLNRLLAIHANIQLQHDFLIYFKQQLLKEAIRWKLAYLKHWLIHRNNITEFFNSIHLNLAAEKCDMDALEAMIPHIQMQRMEHMASTLTVKLLKHCDPSQPVLSALDEKKLTFLYNIRMAAQYGRLNALRYFIDARFQDPETPLEHLQDTLFDSFALAMRNGQTEAVVLLLDEYRNLTISGDPDMTFTTETAFKTNYLETFVAFYERFKHERDFDLDIQRALILSTPKIIEFLLFNLRGRIDSVRLDETIYAITHSFPLNHLRIIWIISKSDYSEDDLNVILDTVPRRYGYQYRELKRFVDQWLLLKKHSVSAKTLRLGI